MALEQRTVNFHFKKPDGTDWNAGEIQIESNRVLADDGVIIPATVIEKTLNSTGAVSVSLYAGVRYSLRDPDGDLLLFDLDAGGASPVDADELIVVPSESLPVNPAALILAAIALSAVRFDAEQTLTDEEKTQARTNIGAGTGSGGGGGAVDSVNTQTGAVVLDTDDISDTSAVNKYVTAAEKTKISNLSGTNTGDNAVNSLYSGLAASKQDVITGLTASGAELNILDGATLSTTELNYVDGVTGAIQTQLDGKVDENAAITGATKTKITYDAKGLVTAGADATTADIADSSNKRYVTDANLVVIGNTSGTNTGDQDLSGKQNTLVSGTNIKTINSTSLLGSGDIVISGGGGIANVVEDTTPQLGGNLDLNTFTVGAASAADLTKLNALTATATELNFVDGVTGAIQTQIDGKQTTLGFTPEDSADKNTSEGYAGLMGGKLGSAQIPTLAASIITSGEFATARIANDAITFAKLQNIATARILGRSTASSGDVEEITIGSGLSLSGGTLSASGGGSGDVTKVGTPVNNQIGIWTGNGTIEGDANLTYDGTTLLLASAKTFQATIATNYIGNVAPNGLTLESYANTLTLNAFNCDIAFKRNGNAKLEVDNTNHATNTPVIIYINSVAHRVSVGAADSESTGFRN